LVFAIWYLLFGICYLVFAIWYLQFAIGNWQFAIMQETIRGKKIFLNLSEFKSAIENRKLKILGEEGTK
jgi:hypothetical protein